MPSQLQDSSCIAVLDPAPGRKAQQPANQARQISDELALRIGSGKFDMWFANAALELKGERLEVATDSPFAAKWIDSHYSGELRDIAEQTLGRAVQIDIRVADAADTAHEGNSARQEKPHAQTDESEWTADGKKRSLRSLHSGEQKHSRANGHLHQRRGPTLRRLDDFVVGSCNKLAYSTACRLAEDADARCISPLFIHGECGVGKTHLLQGICQRHIELSGRSQQVRYVTGEQFTNEYIAAVRSDGIEAFRQRIRKLDLLAIDDVHFLSNKSRTQTEFLYTLDAIDLSGARVVLASDNHPHHIKRFDKSLVSRFLAGMVVKIDPPDRATRVELIQRLAAARGLRINAAAIEVVAGNCVGSVREIEGALTKLAAYGSLLNGHLRQGDNDRVESADEIGLVLAEQVFRDHAWQPTQVVRMGAVIEAVCTRLSVVKADLFGSGRHRRVVLARALVAYLGRELTTHSFPEIAQSLGRANHSTIHTADQRLRKQITSNVPLNLGGGDTAIDLKEIVDQLRRQITRIIA